MTKLLSAALIAFACLLPAGCRQLDTTPPGGPDRVISGVVTDGSNALLPADSEVTVRILDDSRGPNAGEELGEQTILNPGALPVPFRVECRADDALLRRGVRVEARIAVGGRLAFANANVHAVTLRNAAEMQVVHVVATGKQ